jgi:hypothetical protein
MAEDSRDLTTPKSPSRRADRSPRLGLSLLAGLCALLLGAPAAHAAAKGPCVPATKRPVCHFWTARTTCVADGATIRTTCPPRRP